MKRNLLKIGLALFPLAGLYCAIAFLVITSIVDSPEYSPIRAERFAKIYSSGFLLSIVGFFACLHSIFGSEVIVWS